MANIDWGTLALGALVGVGCRKQLKTAGRVVATTAASLAGVAAQTAAQVAEETQKTKKSPEQEQAEQRLAEVDQKINQLLQEWQGKGNGQG